MMRVVERRCQLFSRRVVYGFMRRLATGLIILLAWPAAAQAHGHNGSHCPYGNSGWGQYGEWIPGANGCQPSQGSGPNGSHPGNSQSSGPVPPSGGGGSASGGAVAPQTAQALAKHGPAGAQAAALARATAPAGVRGLARPKSGRGKAGLRTTGGGHGAPGSSGAPLPPSSSPTAQLAKALTGSSGSGLGWLLPAILAAILVGALLRRVRRTRRPTA
jgi:hypothetical protein